ncbi:glycosyltransferase [Thermotoga sp. SG1]|uniref:glycosyltransferase n=1 Tax=Thermotoga sp. SG1 TaxID=126739 RepID=UPI000C75D941|nr:glycosyltransferase [Thermotoga sp. SG1]PLV56869.1 glycosyl transferase family A [Thermotoga sp. SG1]
MEIFEKIQKAIEQKDFSKAKEIAEKIDDETERYNALGIVHYYEGKKEEAQTFFEKALKINPVHDDVLFNYSKVLLEKGEYFESWRYLTRINEKTWEVYDMLGDTQLQQNNLAMALHHYRKASKLSGILEMKEKYEALKKQFKKDTKVAFLCLPGLDHFIKDIANILSEMYEVKLVVTKDGKQIVDAYNWADIVWLEWANELAVEITGKLPKGNKRILCRLHSYEALVNYPERINWNNVDTLILVADHMKDVLKDYHQSVYEKIKNKIKVIPNGVDLNRFRFKVRSPGFNIAVVAHINHKKAPEMWLQVIGLLKSIDERYTLHVAGDFQELRYANYFKYFIKETGLEKNVKLYGFVHNIEEFLEDMNYVLSTSVHESFGYNIAEAMACGIKPLIHNYHGAKNQWSESLIFNFIGEIPNLIKGKYESEKYRRYVEDNYSLESQIKNIADMIESLPKAKIKVEQVKEKGVWDNLWKRYSEHDILSLVNSPEGKVLRSEFVNLLNRFFVLKGSKILEAGCGSGIISIDLSKRGAHYTGIDISQDSVNLSEKVASFFELRNVNFRKMDAFNTVFSEREFDIVFNIGVVEHFQDEDIIKMLKEMARVGRFIVVGVPYSGSQIYELSEEISQESGTWEYGSERDFYSLKDLFEKAGVRLLHEEIIGSFSEPFCLKRINPSLIKKQLARNLEKMLQGEENIGSWLLAIGTNDKTCEEIFEKARKENGRVVFSPQLEIVKTRYPSVSIVIPFLNARKYIKSTVEDLYLLSYSNFEVVFVNDGSTDGSAEEIEKLLAKEKKFPYKILNLEKNEGPFLARYRGTLAADGEYIVYHNIDDRLQLNGINRLFLDTANFRKNALLAVSVALMENRKCTGDVWLIDIERKPLDYFWKTMEFLSGEIHPINTLVPKKFLLESYSSLVSLLEEYGKNFSVGEDVLLAYQMVLDGALEDIVPVYYTFEGYEIGNVSSVSKNIEKRVQSLPLVISYIVVSLAKKHLVDFNQLKGIENHIRSRAKTLYGEILGEKFWENFLKYKNFFEKILN